MQADLIARYDRSVPRYTSYPTAPHFTPAIDRETYARWLGETAPDAVASLYLHIPFCHEMCWYCGCNTRVVRRPEPIATYVDDLISEIDAVADALPSRLTAGHIHFGGGSPNTLAPGDLVRLIDHLRQRFDTNRDTEIAVEIDPRTTDDAFIQACAESGVTRASIGVQDLNDDVQRAVNRVQPFEKIAEIFSAFEASGIDDINVDLMYGLPRQTVEKVVQTVERMLQLEPEQVALFGYAHVPWMKRHMRLIDEALLPDISQRWAQSEAASQRLQDAGYQTIGMDHFARPDSVLAAAALSGNLHRNFQGYTTDGATALLGFGASAIGTLAEGYVQNDPDVRAWRQAISNGGLATARGRQLTGDDRARRDIIWRLMCDMSVDVERVALDHGVEPEPFHADLTALAPMRQDGLLELDGAKVRMTPAGRPLVRVAAAAFDRYLSNGDNSSPRHAKAV